MKYTQRGFIVQGIIAVMAVILIAGGFYYMGKKNSAAPAQNVVVDTTPVPDVKNELKTHTDAKQGYSFQYPAKLSLGIVSGLVNLSHTIPFENRDGGCDMMGDVELSATLTDFSVKFEVLPGEVKPPYIDGLYSAGQLNGNYAYMGAEGCGQTKYYFPVNGNRTLVVTKNELQVLSPVVSAEVRNRVLAVPGVISYEEANTLLKNILTSFKFTSPAIPASTNSQPSVKVLSPNGGEVLKFADKNLITWNYAGLDSKDTLTIGFRNRVGTGSACWIKGIPVGNKKLEYIAGKVLCENGVKIMSGDQYKIELIVDKYNTGRGVADTSDNYFTITN